MKGTVKWFNRVKGYGFIISEDGAQEVFVHYSAILTENKKDRLLDEKQAVEFEVVQGARGPSAIKVRKV